MSRIRSFFFFFLRTDGTGTYLDGFVSQVSTPEASKRAIIP